MDEYQLTKFSKRKAFFFWSQEKIRYQDLDPNGHVSNIAYLVYAEGARLALRRSVTDRTLHADADADADAGVWVIASSAIKFLKPSLFPGVIEIGVTLIHAGRTSFSLGYGMFQKDDCVAVACSRSVQVDSQTKMPVPLSENFLQAMQLIAK